jgi:PEP-CTERM motif
MKLIRNVSALLLLAGLASAASAAVIGPTGYTQNFNSMTGTTYPDGWAGYVVAGSHDTFTPPDDPVNTGVYPSGTAITAQGLTAATIVTHAVPAATAGVKSSNVYNWGPITGDGQALGTSPTGTAGMLLQLTLTNDQAAPITDLSIAYDVRVFSTTVMNNNYSGDTAYANGTIEELPGYWMFYSLDNGTTWTNVAALNTNGHTWANAVGVVHESVADVTLSSPWNAGSTIKLWWFDDNAQGPSPDQNLGLDNVAISSAVPEPASLAFIAAGILALMGRRRRV